MLSNSTFKIHTKWKRKRKTYRKMKRSTEERHTQTHRNLESIYLYFPPSSQLLFLCFCPVGLSSTVDSCPSQETEVTSTPTRPVDNVVIATKGLQDRNTKIIAGTTVENKGKLILMCATFSLGFDFNLNYFILFYFSD